MRKVFFIFLAALFLGKASLFASCTTSDDHAAGKYEQTTYIPQAPLGSILRWRCGTYLCTAIHHRIGFPAGSNEDGRHHVAVL